ncbi:MAG: hypothetical protein H0X38_15625 [Planctomycetes bacterium]|nr:hypothetical protein [Planctomycetota bacterium]
MKFLLWLLFFRDIGGKDVEIVWPPKLPNAATPLSKLLFLVLAAALVAAIVWVYRKEPDYVLPRRKRQLTGLRAAAGLVLLFMLTGAFLDVLHREESKGTLVVLVDTSASMSIADRQGDGADAKALRAVLGAGAPAADADLDKLSRSELVKRALANQDLGFLKGLEGKFKLEAYTFGQTASLAPLELGASDATGGPLAGLPAPTETATQLGGALRDTARRLKGRKVDGVLVLTDGGWNRGEEPLIAAQDLGVPVFPIGVGAPQTRDIAIPFISADDVVFKGDSFPLTVRVRQRGYTGQTVRLVVKQVDEASKAEELVGEQQIEFDDQGERTHVIEIAPKKAGTFTFVAEIEPLKDELSADNNRKQKPGVTVVDKKIRVLLVEDGPRWEMRFLTSILEADTQRIDPSFVIRQLDERVAAGDPRYKREFPRTLPELRAYDVVVLGDIGGDSFTKDELKNLSDYVQKEGGGLLLVAGRNHLPDTYAGTPIEDLLPIEFDPQAPFAVEDELQRSIRTAFRPVLTAEGKRSAVLRFAADSHENELLWEKAEPLYWCVPARRLKPGASALLVQPGGGRSGQEAGTPVIAQERYGKGQVLYVGSDETWRWRFKPGAQYQRRMWSQMISSLSMAHLLGKANRVQIETDRSEYAVGDKAELIARILDKDFNKLVADNVTAVIDRGGLGKDNVVLTAVKDQPGMFKGEYTPAAEGDYSIAIQGEEDEADRAFKAVVPRIEFDDPGMRAELLQQLASATSGTYQPLSGLAAMADVLKEQKHVLEPRREERTLWNAPGLLVLIAMLLGLEWFLRKRADLL